ncbi:MAG: rhodanese-like domain-containing protein [Proteobacteria bacterium]|nr:rhodanese-like domain-containing protein [Pseudomonadota bacterium]
MVRRVVVLLFTLIGLAQAYSACAAEQDENSVWIDVRSAREYRAGHIEGAINIPAGDIGHKMFESVDDVFKTVHLYDGSSGTFAGLALELLMEMGFNEVINEGGYAQLLVKQSAAEQ